MTYFFVVSFFYIDWDCVPVLHKKDLSLPTLGFVGYWVELDLGAEMRNSMRPHSDEYSLGSVVLC